MTDVLTFADVSDSLVPKAAQYVGRRYGRYGAGADDMAQEMYEYLYGKGATKVRRWLASDPQQTARIWWSLIDHGRAYGEKEKAARLGHEPDDIFWYTPTIVQDALPLVLDPAFDGQMAVADESGRKHKKAPNEGGDALTTIVDIRRAISRCPEWVEFSLRGATGGAGWDEALAAVVAVLGGERPSPGSRRVISNAAAQHLTHAQEAD